MRASYRLTLWWLGLNSLDKLCVGASVLLGVFVIVMFGLIVGAL